MVVTAGKKQPLGGGCWARETRLLPAEQVPAGASLLTPSWCTWHTAVATRAGLAQECRRWLPCPFKGLLDAQDPPPRAQGHEVRVSRATLSSRRELLPERHAGPGLGQPASSRDGQGMSQAGAQGLGMVRLSVQPRLLPPGPESSASPKAGATRRVPARGCSLSLGYAPGPQADLSPCRGRR